MKICQRCDSISFSPMAVSTPSCAVFNTVCSFKSRLIFLFCDEAVLSFLTPRALLAIENLLWVWFPFRHMGLRLLTRGKVGSEGFCCRCSFFYLRAPFRNLPTKIIAWWAADLLQRQYVGLCDDRQNVFWSENRQTAKDIKSDNKVQQKNDPIPVPFSSTLPSSRMSNKHIEFTAVNNHKSQGTSFHL